MSKSMRLQDRGPVFESRQGQCLSDRHAPCCLIQFSNAGIALCMKWMDLPPIVPVLIKDCSVSLAGVYRERRSLTL